jgi:membrane protease subunit HflK
MRYLLGIAALLLVAYLLTGVTQVRPGERAVVRRFGRVLEEKPEPGLWVGLPWGMDRVDRIAVDLVRPVEVGYRGDDDPETTPAGQLLTGDHNLVNLRLVVNYRVRPEQVEDYLAQVDSGGTGADDIDRLVAAAAETLVAEWVGSRTVDDVLLRGKAELPRWLTEYPEQRLEKPRLEKRLEPYRLGIQITNATVSLLSPPDEVKVSFDAVTQAQTSIRTRIYTAERDAQDRVRTAESDHYRITQSALAYATEQRLQAQADAATFDKRWEQYQAAKKDNPAVLSAIWWDAMAELLERMKVNGHIDLLDHHLGADGLDLTQVPLPRKP